MSRHGNDLNAPEETKIKVNQEQPSCIKKGPHKLRAFFDAGKYGNLMDYSLNCVTFVT